MVGGYQDFIIRDRRISMEFNGTAILFGVVDPDQLATALVECTKEAVTRTDEEEISRDRGGGENSATSLYLPMDSRWGMNLLRQRT